MLISLEKTQSWGRRGSISSMGCDVFDLPIALKTIVNFECCFPTVGEAKVNEIGATSYRRARTPAVQRRPPTYSSDDTGSSFTQKQNDELCRKIWPKLCVSFVRVQTGWFSSCFMFDGFGRIDVPFLICCLPLVLFSHFTFIVDERNATRNEIIRAL